MWNRVVLLSIMASLGVISASLCAPALPFISDYFSLSVASTQFTISVFLLGNALGQFLSGALADQLGQRKVLLAGLLVYTFASASCAVADHMIFLLLARFFQGMGSAAGPVLARALAVSSFPAERSAQVQSYGAIGVGIASILAILYSGRMTQISWRGNFWIGVLLGLLLLIWAQRTLKKPHVFVSRLISWNQLFSQMKQVWKHPYFIYPTFCHGITYGLMYGYIALFPFFMRELFQEKNPFQVGIYSAYMICFYMLGAFLVSRWVLRWLPLRLMYVGIMVQGISGLFLTFGHFSWVLFPALFLFNFSIGMILPMTTATALSSFSGSFVGTASSILGLSYRVLGSLISMFICQLSLSGGRSLGICIFCFSLVSLFALKRMSFSYKQNLSYSDL